MQINISVEVIPSQGRGDVIGVSCPSLPTEGADANKQTEIDQ